MDIPKKQVTIYHHRIAKLLFISCKFSGRSKLRKYAFSFINLLILLACIDVFFEHLVLEHAKYKTVFGLYSVLILGPAISAFISNLISPHGTAEIIKSIDSVFLSNELNPGKINIEYTFTKAISCHIVNISFSLIVLIVSRWIDRPFYSMNNSLSIVVIILNFSKNFTILQCVYLIELSKMILELLSLRMLEHSQMKRMNGHQSIQALFKLKRIHLRIWEIIDGINKHYGSTFIVIFAEAYINASRALYILFIYFYDFEGSHHVVLRKYKFVVHILK